MARAFGLMGADKAERLAYRKVFIPKTADFVLELADIAIYRYPCGKGTAVMTFWGSAGKPTSHYSYRTLTAANAFIDQQLDAVSLHRVEQIRKRATKAAWVNPLKVGDLLSTCWGYDQTNVEFYAVTKVNGKRTWIRMICSDYEAAGYMAGKTWPAMPIRFIEEKPVHEESDAWSRLLRGQETMHIAQPSGTDVYLRISDSISAHRETGREHYTSSYA